MSEAPADAAPAQPDKRKKNTKATTKNDAAGSRKKGKKTAVDQPADSQASTDAPSQPASQTLSPSTFLVDLERNAAEMRALLLQSQSQQAPSSAPSQAASAAPATPATPASMPSQSSSANAQLPTALGASAPSSQASAVAPVFPAPPSQPPASASASQLSTQSVTLQLTPPPPPSVAPPPASSAPQTPLYHPLSSQGASQSPSSSVAPSQQAAAAQNSPVLDEQTAVSQSSSRHNHAKNLPPPPRNGQSAAPKHPPGQYRYARFIERADRRRKSGFPPEIDFNAHLAYRKERRKIDPRLQVSKEDIERWTAKVFEPHRDKQIHIKRWITAHYNTDSSNRVRIRRACFDEFNRALLGSDPGELTDEAARLIAARVLLQPGELSVNDAELIYIWHLWGRWCCSKKATEDAIQDDLKNHYFPDEETRKKGRKRVPTDGDDDDDRPDDSSAAPMRISKKKDAESSDEASAGNKGNKE